LGFRTGSRRSLKKAAGLRQEDILDDLAKVLSEFRVSASYRSQLEEADRLLNWGTLADSWLGRVQDLKKAMIICLIELLEIRLETIKRSLFPSAG
jgi:hypothetical protein